MAAVAAPFAYYATLVSSGIFGLTALPQLFKPVPLFAAQTHVWASMLSVYIIHDLTS